MITRHDLEDALEGMCEMLPYVPEYFREKHGLDMYVIRAENVLRRDRAANSRPPELQIADLQHVNEQLRDKLKRNGLWDDPE